VAALVLFLVPLAVLAEGPGSRIGTTPQVPLPEQPVAPELTKRCEALRGVERDRCVKKARTAAPSTGKPSGPETTGMGSGASTDASSGASSTGR
jgi:hypothetical protein